MRFALSATGVALVLAGCASTPREAPPGAATGPSTSLPTAWQAPLPHGGTAQDLAQWWAQFNDPLLPELIGAAQAASPTLASAKARIERARAALVSAGAAAWPRLDAVGSASGGKQQPGQARVDSLSLGVQAGWEIDLFGAVSAGRRAAQARLEGAEAGWHDARVSLAADVALQYINLRACEAQAEQSDLDAASRIQTAQLSDQSAKSGFTAPADAALVRAGAAQARSQAVAQRAQCQTLVKTLVELTDLPEPALRDRLNSGKAKLPQPAPIAVSALPAELLNQRPDLADAARAVVAAAGDRAQSRARELPQLSLSGSLAAAQLRSGGFTTDGTTWSIGPLVLTLPLFDAGARSAATAAAQAGYDEAVALYRGQLRRALREVESSLVALDATASREADAQGAARDFETSLVATQARQRGGLASLLDLEAARRNALQAQSALISLQQERATAWINLYRALGGGWKATQTTAAAKP
jgi:outer membrane protein, multidrug efflux system